MVNCWSNRSEKKRTIVHRNRLYYRVSQSATVGERKRESESESAVCIMFVHMLCMFIRRTFSYTYIFISIVYSKGYVYA